MSWMQMNHFSRHNLVADQKRFKSTHHTIYTSLDTSLPSVLGATNTWIVENWFHSENHSQHSLLKKKETKWKPVLSLLRYWSWWGRDSQQRLLSPSIILLNNFPAFMSFFVTRYMVLLSPLYICKNAKFRPLQCWKQLSPDQWRSVV